MEIEHVGVFRDAMLDQIQMVHAGSIRLTKPASSHAFDSILWEKGFVNVGKGTSQQHTVPFPIEQGPPGQKGEQFCAACVGARYVTVYRASCHPNIMQLGCRLIAWWLCRPPW